MLDAMRGKGSVIRVFQALSNQAFNSRPNLAQLISLSSTTSS